jgi:hypothetical protein
MFLNTRMTFEQLFNHMEKYIGSPEERWKLVTRVKRGITDPKRVGAYSRDQCYFEGAIEILENLDDIDFNLLMCGKICVDELEIVKDIACMSGLKIPKFMKSGMKAYKNKLRQIGIVNEILGPNQGNNDSATEEDIRRFIKNEIAEVKNIQVSLPRMDDIQQQSMDANNSSLCNIL